MSRPGRRRRAAAVAALSSVLALLMGACASLGSARPPPAFAGSVRIGVAGPFTGPLAHEGLALADGVALAADDANAEGGVIGLRLEVVVADDGGTEAGARSAAARLVTAGVVAVIGHAGEEPSVAAAPLYSAAGVVQLVPSVVATGLTSDGSPTVFRLSAAAPAVTPAIVAALVDDGRRRVVSVGGTLPGAAEVTPGAVAGSGADAAAVLDRDVLTAIVAGALRTGSVGPALYGAPAVVDWAALGPDGTVVAALHPNRVNGKQANTDLVRRARDRFGRDPGYDTPAAYVGLATWVAGARSARSTAGPAVAAALHGAGFRYDSMIGEIAFAANGDLLDAHLYRQRVSGGRLFPA